MAEINLKKNILISASFRVLIMGLSFLTGWISTRFLGVELKGRYSYLITIMSFTWIALDLGIHKTYPYLIRKEASRQNQLFTWSILQFIAEFTLIASLGLLFTPFLRELLNYPFQSLTVLLMAGAISLTKLSQHMQMIYYGQDRIGRCSLYQFLNSLVMLLLVALGWMLFKSVDRLHFVLGAYVLAMLVAVLCFILPQLATRFWKGFQLRYILRSYSLGWKVFLSGLFITLLIRFDVVLIRHFRGFTDLGVYAVAANVVDMLQLAANLVGSLLLVKLSDITDDVERWRLLKKVFLFFFLLLGAANAGFVAVGKPLLTWMYGRDFTGVYNIYLWLIPASFGLSFGSLFNTYLWSKGFPIISVLLPLLALLLNIGLNFIFIPAMGIRGAALATSIAYVAWFLSILLYEHFNSGKRIIRHLVPSGSDFAEIAATARSSIHKVTSSLSRKG
jgi:O-antigen/teichoic acid export membrane protein